MQEQSIVTTVTPSRARVALKSSAARVGERGNLLTLTLSLLFCLMTAFTAYLIASVLGEVLYHFTFLSEEDVTLIFWLAILVLAVLLILPLFVGRVRMAGLIAKGRTPLVRETLYYFSSPRRYLRGVLIGIVYLLSIGTPVALTVFGFHATYLLYANLLVIELEKVWAVLLLILGYHVCVAFALLLLFLSGIWQPSVAVATGNEEISVARATRIGIRLGCRSLGESFRFSWHFLLRALFSLLTVGVLWLLYYGEHLTVAYNAYVMASEE